MNKRIKLLLVGLTSLLFIPNVYAASASLRVSRGTIENGSTVTASVTVSAASWNIKINSSGATGGCSNSFADASENGKDTTKTFSVTCRATSTGIINFSLSGDVTGANGANVSVGGSKQVKVTPPREKSANNMLKSLTVDGYEISPVFDQNTKDYSVTVPSTVDKVVINAVTADGYATVAGAGEQLVEEGINTFDITVTSETGLTNIYKLLITVEDINPIEIKIDGNKYTLIKNAKNLTKPLLFEPTTIKIKGFDIPAFVNEKNKLTIVGIKDKKGTIHYAIYDNGKYSMYNEITNGTLTVMVLSLDKELKGYIKSTIEINGIKVDCYKVKKNSRFAIIYGLDLNTSKKDFYTYDTKDKTIMAYNDEMISSLETMNTYLLYGSIAFGAGLFLSLVALISTSKKKRNKVKKEKKIKREESVVEEEKEVVENEIVSEDKQDNISEETEVYDIFENNKKKNKKKKKN